MGLKRRLGITLDMLRTMGLQPAVEQIVSTGHDWLAERRRRREFRRLKLVEPVERDIIGNRMRLDPARPGLDRDLLLHGIREPVATGHIMRILRPDDVVLEAGANIGYYSLIESKICRKVYAVEPHPENFSRLQQHLKMNGADNVEAYNLAFGPADGELHLECSPLSNWHSCLGADPNGKSVITVPGRSIDSFVNERETPTFLRMDIEGFEVEALKGAANTLRRLRGLFIELHSPNLTYMQIQETLDMIAVAGLSPSLIIQYDWPGLSQVYSPARIEEIRRGDRCTYELFFERLDGQ